MTPEEVHLSFTSAHNGRTFRDEWVAATGGWAFSTMVNGDHSGDTVVTSLDVEVVDDTPGPQPDHATITWREPGGARRFIIDKVRPGVWARSEEVESQTGDGWQGVGCEEVTNLRLDFAAASETSVTRAEP